VLEYNQRQVHVLYGQLTLHMYTVVIQFIHVTNISLQGGSVLYND